MRLLVRGCKDAAKETSPGEQGQPRRSRALLARSQPFTYRRVSGAIRAFAGIRRLRAEY